MHPRPASTFALLALLVASSSGTAQTLEGSPLWDPTDEGAGDTVMVAGRPLASGSPLVDDTVRQMRAPWELRCILFGGVMDYERSNGGSVGSESDPFLRFRTQHDLTCDIVADDPPMLRMAAHTQIYWCPSDGPADTEPEDLHDCCIRNGEWHCPQFRAEEERLVVPEKGNNVVASGFSWVCKKLPNPLACVIKYVGKDAHWHWETETLDWNCWECAGSGWLYDASYYVISVPPPQSGDAKWDLERTKGSHYCDSTERYRDGLEWKENYCSEYPEYHHYVYTPPDCRNICPDVMVGRSPPGVLLPEVVKASS